MINITEEGKQAYLNRDDIQLSLRFENGLVLTNDDFVSGSFSLEQTLCDEEQIVYGSVGSACLSIQIIKNLQAYKGMRFSAYFQAGGGNEVALGTFTVTEDTLSDNRRIRSLTAYDDVYLNMDKDLNSWYESLSYPLTLFEFRNSLFNYVGINQEQVFLVNDGMTVRKTVDVAETVLTFKDVVGAICEINGALGCITQYNNFRYVTPDLYNDALYPHDDLYPSEDLYPKDYFNPGLFPNNNLYPSDTLYPSDPTIATTLYVNDNTIIKQGSYVYKDYIVRPIEKVVIKESDEDYGTIYGDGTNTYEVIGNFLCFAGDELEDIAYKLHGIISKVSYQPCKLTTLGLPWVEVGDYLKIIGNQGTSIFPILHRTLSGITAMTDSFEAQGTEYSETQFNGTNGSLRNLLSRTLKLRADITEVSSELYQYEEKTDGTLEEVSSKITQLPHSIELSVTGGTLSKDSKASIKLTVKDEDGNILDSSDGTITLSGNVIFASNLIDGTTTISGSNIKTGAITLGGTVNGDGSIFIRDSSNRVLIKLNKYGMALNNENENNIVILDHGGLYFFNNSGALKAYFKEDDIQIKDGFLTTSSSDGLLIAGIFPNNDSNNNIWTIDGVTRKVIFGVLSRDSTNTSWNQRFAVDSHGNTAVGRGADLFVEDISTLIAGNGITMNAAGPGFTLWGSFNNHSDKRWKQDIVELGDSFIEVVYALKPISFKYNDKYKDSDDKTHYGFIAQDVKAVLEDNNIDTDNLSLYQETNVKDRDKNLIDACLLSYQEFIPLITLTVQSQKKEIDLLKEEIELLKQEINELKGEE